MNQQLLNHRKSVKPLGLALAMLLLALFVPGVCKGVTLSLHAGGYSFIANPFIGASDIESVLTCLQPGDMVGLWDCTTRKFEYYIYDGPGIWFDSSFNVVGSPACPPPGEGFVYYNGGGSTETLTLAGVAGSGAASMPCGCGNFNLVSRTSPTVATYDDIVGAPPVNGSQLAQWNGAGFNFYTFACGAWTPSVPSVGIATPVFIKVPCSVQSGVVVSIEGPAVSAPGFGSGYFITVNNFGPGSSAPATLTLAGIPSFPLMTLSSSYTTAPGGFTVSVPALAGCGSSASYFFGMAGGTEPIGSSFTMSASLDIPSTPDSLTVNMVASVDPNDKSGPTGSGPHHYLVGSPMLPYAITFENQPSATAPAQRVVITDQLDPTTMDLGSFQFGGITFGSKVVTPPSGVNSYNITVPYDVDGNPLTTADNINVQIDAALDLNFLSPTCGTVTWTFQSLDPATGLPPTNPLIGFLPPNSTPPQGQGMVTFTVNPVPGLMTGDLITNFASIVFDANAPITTGIWTNSIIKTMPDLTIEKVVNQVKITWASWTLVEASSLAGPWTNSAVQVSPWTFTPSESTKFYRLQVP